MCEPVLIIVIYSVLFDGSSGLAATQSVILEIYHSVGRQFCVCAVQLLYRGRQCESHWVHACSSSRYFLNSIKPSRQARHTTASSTKRAVESLIQSPLWNMLKRQRSSFNVFTSTEAAAAAAAVVAPWKEHSGGLKGALINCLLLRDSSFDLLLNQLEFVTCRPVG